MRARCAQPAAAGRLRRTTTAVPASTDRRRAARTGRTSRAAGSPIAPSRIARPTVARSGAQRNSCPTRCVTPAPPRPRASPRPRRASSANGFSQSTCLPARAAAIAMSACVCGGVAIVTASTPSSARAAPQLGGPERDVEARWPAGSSARRRDRRARARRSRRPAARERGRGSRSRCRRRSRQAALVALVGVDDAVQRLARDVAPQVVRERLRRSASKAFGDDHETCAETRTFG